MSSKKASEKAYVVLIFVFLILVYYWLVFITYIKDLRKTLSTYFFLSLGHIMLFMIIWSIIATMSTDPGIQPVFWVS